MKGIYNKFLSLFLVITTLFNTVVSPLTVLAETTQNSGDLRYDNQYIRENNGSVSVTEGSFVNPGDVEVRKTVTKLDSNGNYEVKFEARGKRTSETTTTTAPIYAVIVFDRSNSMDDYTKWINAKSAAKTFATSLHEKYPTANIAMVLFADDAEVTRQFSPTDFSSYDDYEIFGFIPMLGTGGGTNLHAGLMEAKKLLNANSVPSNAKKYVVVISDGQPTFYIEDDGTTGGTGSSTSKELLDATFEEATALKGLAEVFTIGYELSSQTICPTDPYKTYTAETVLKQVASKESNYYSANVSNITNAINNVLAQTTSYSPAATNLVITDNIGSAFTSTADTDSDGVIELKLDSTTLEDSNAWQEVGKFTITIDKDSETKWHQTNNNFSYTYDGLKTPVTCSKNPEVYWVKQKYDYSIEYYYDGVLDSSKTTSGQKYKDEVVYVTDAEIEANLKTGYKLSTVNPSKQITINNSGENKIKIYYIIDESQTKEISYTVEYYKDGVKAENDTEVVKETVQVLEPDTLEVDKTQINIVDKYLGYKLDLEATREIPNVIQNNGLIKIYYIKNSYSYVVEYYIENLEGNFEIVEEDTTKYENVLFDTDATYEIYEYEGYTFDETKTENANSKVPANDELVIRLYYTRNDSNVIVYYVVKVGDNYISFDKYGRDEFGNNTPDFKDIELENSVLTGKIGSLFTTTYREVPEYNLIGIYNGNILENTDLEKLNGTEVTSTFELETKEYTYVYEVPMGESEELPPQTGVELSTSYINYVLLIGVVYILKKYFDLISTK